MSRETRHYLSLIAASFALVILIRLAVTEPLSADDLLPGLLFGALIVFTTTFGLPLGGGWVSLLPMVTVAGFLVLGLAPIGWTVFAATLVQQGIRYLLANRLEVRREPGLVGPLGLAAANAFLHTASILAGGLVYFWSGGVTPLTTNEVIYPTAVLASATYLVVNHVLAAAYIGARGLEPLRHYLRSLPRLLLYEGGPLVLSPMIALIYTRLGMTQFVRFALVLIVASLITRNLGLARQRLERRVKELDSLHAVGQALSASLDLDTILRAIYAQVARLMRAQNFFIALRDPAADEVSFPLAMENGRPTHYRSRRAGDGLTEYVLRSRTPLLIREDFVGTLERLGVTQMLPQPAAAWLGVPILAGAEPLGVIAVQSFSNPGEYDASHREVLVTIAAQAAIAIQNARLYARTDLALARRVQELDSILRTTRDGILLLDTEWRVRAANRALADFLGLVEVELHGSLAAPRPGGDRPLIDLVGYTAEDLRRDCRDLLGEAGIRRSRLTAPGPPERPIERTLAAVRDPRPASGSGIAGWLMVFRDISEEAQLAALREELTHMLIHDLRAPLGALIGGLGTIESLLTERQDDTLDELLAMARQGGYRMLGLIDGLLEIGRLESGLLPVHHEFIEVGRLLAEVAARFEPSAATARIQIVVTAPESLPRLKADPGLVTRVLINLVDNAIKFTPDGGSVRLSASLEEPQTAGALRIAVSDTGCGIPVEAQAQLFRKFQQAPAGFARRRGTGLGLAFCRLVAEAHGGRIGVESAAGQGATFVVKLPIGT